MRRVVVALVALLVGSLSAAAPLRAQDETDALLAKLAGADPELRTYRADVVFDVGLKTFPFLRKTLHGNAYFKRPSHMEIVFTDLPPFVRSFKNLYVGLGTPVEWEKKFSIGSAAEQTDGRVVRYLVLTPRKADRRLRHVDIYIDAQTSLPERIVWYYRDGRIDMHQSFGFVQGHDVVVAQHADIRLPAVHAFINASISNYAVNVDVQDAVFTRKPDPQPTP